MKHYGATIHVSEGTVVRNLTAPTGTSFPDEANIGELFYRTDTSKLYVCSFEGSPVSWIDIMSSGSASATFQRVSVAAATYTQDPTDTFIGVNYAGPVTVTMANDLTPGFILTVKDESGNSINNNITILPTNGETIDGQTSAVIGINYGALRIQWTGFEWSLI